MIETVAPIVDITWPSQTNTMGDGSIDAKEKIQLTGFVGRGP